MHWKLFYGNLLLLWFCCTVTAEDPEVETPLGIVRGFHMVTRGGRNISAFTSIPYALPPNGELRFKAPQPILPWTGVYDATKSSPACVGRNPYIREKDIAGQEDCLYLNIYTPYTANDLELKDKRQLPVMMFIHGGGWMCGSSSTYMYGPEYLLDRDVVLVTTNYRLGALGFLSTQDEHCPGNNGLKDQQEALRFIQKTIHSFGGDRDSVTIFGESAGGTSVHYHMLSETSAGLFHKAISESGVALVPWAEASPGEPKNQAFRLAKLLGCPQAPSDRMLECLRTRDSYDIIGTEFQFYAWDYEPMTPFKAVVEPDLPGAFLTRSPRVAPNVPSVPWMTGLNSDEGCLKSGWITANETLFQEFVTGFESIAPVTYYYVNSPFTDVITKKIKKLYINTSDLKQLKTGITDSYSDSYFAYPMVKSVELTLNYTKAPVYLYELTYKTTPTFSKIFGDPEGKYGVCHADELIHLFPIHFLDNPSPADIEFGQVFLTLWTNFATTGNPNKPKAVSAKWEPVSSSDTMEYFDLNPELKMKRNLASRSRVWETLPLWHNVPPQTFHDEL